MQRKHHLSSCLPAPESKPSRLIHIVAATHIRVLKQTGLRSEFPSLSLETSLPWVSWWDLISLLRVNPQKSASMAKPHWTRCSHASPAHVESWDRAAQHQGLLRVLYGAGGGEAEDNTEDGGSTSNETGLLPRRGGHKFPTIPGVERALILGRQENAGTPGYGPRCPWWWSATPKF